MKCITKDEWDDWQRFFEDYNLTEQEKQTILDRLGRNIKAIRVVKGDDYGVVTDRDPTN
jgi:hypothetical protein